MKKLLILLTLLALILTACSSDKPEPDADVLEASAAPVAGEISLPDYAEGNKIDEMPDIGTDETAPPVVDAYSYRYTNITEGNFTMEYPSHWERVPGRSTLCYVEPSTNDLIPGRLTVVRKTVSKKPDKNAKTEQLNQYFQCILEGFNTYDIGKLDKKAEFLGDKEAFQVTYTATKGELLYKGYVIMAAKNKTLYIYHFRCAETAFGRMIPIMEHIRDSISIKKDK